MVKISFNTVARRADKRIADPKVASEAKVKKTPHNIEILNISRGGLRFKSNEEFEKNDVLWFDLRSTDAHTDLSLSIRGKVVNLYGKNETDSYEYGVKFFHILHWYEMNCIHNFVHGNSGDERTKNYRLKG